MATLQEIDDAVRYSWGLRRAAMGSYRIAGGGKRVRQSIEQWEFKWPLSRLTDKPDINRQFLDKAEARADALVKSAPLESLPNRSATTCWWPCCTHCVHKGTAQARRCCAGNRGSALALTR